MSFNRDAFASEIETHLENIVDGIYHHRLVHGIKARPKSIARLRVRLTEPERDRLNIEGCSSKELSAHEKLEDIRLIARAKSSARHIAERIAEEAPILADDNMTVEINVGLRVKAGSRAVLSISQRIVGYLDHLELVKDIATRTSLAIERIGGLPGGPRVFQFSSGNLIHARTPEDAYRAHAAFCHPHLFNAPSTDFKRAPTISEILDKSSCLKALQHKP